MSHPLSVTSVAFVHTEDIDSKNQLNAGALNARVEKCVDCAIAALQNATTTHTDVQTRHMAGVLTSVRWTHRAIRRMLSWQGSDKPMAVDGLSLARISMEGLYATCLMVDDPSWVDRYLRDGWVKSYTHFLLQREETRFLPSFDAFNNTHGPGSLEQLRVLLGITVEQKATIDHDQLGTPLPVGMKAEPLPRFPTPAGSLKQFQPGPQKAMLERLYPEYVWLCSFSHGLPDAMFYKIMSDPNSPAGLLTDEAHSEETFQRRVREPAFFLSVLSVLQAATEILVLYPESVALRVATSASWTELSEGVLLGRAIWNLRTKGLLGIVG